MCLQSFWYFVHYQLSHWCFCIVFLFFDIYCIHQYTFLYSSLLLATSSITFHFSLCSAVSISWCNWIISTLNFLFFGVYTFLFFNTKSPFTCHLSSLNTLTYVFFISFATLTTSLFFSLAIFIFPLYLLLVLWLLLQLNYKSIVL